MNWWKSLKTSTATCWILMTSPMPCSACWKTCPDSKPQRKALSTNLLNNYGENIMTKKITVPAAKSATKAAPVAAKPTAPAAATPATPTKPAPAAVEPKKIDMNKPLIKDAIAKGKELLKEGKTKAD